MISSRTLAELVLSWKGAVLVTALFVVLHFRKRLLKARKSLKVHWRWFQRCLVLLSALWWLWMAAYAHIAVSRAGVLLFLLWYWWLWNKRFRQAKGKQREVYHLMAGENYADRERLARQARERAVDLHPHDAAGRYLRASVVVEGKTCHERLIGQFTSILGGRIWRRQNPQRRAHDKRLF
jgi:hypothetical protein